jgi:integrase
MAKEINTYRDLSITWVKKANRFQLDARPLGGTRMRVKTKAEASQTAKELFDKWTEGTPIVEQERWSVDTAIEKYFGIGKIRSDDAEDTYGAGYLSQQIQQLGVIQKLMIGEFRLGSMKVDKITTDHMVYDFWPELKKRSNSDMTAMSYYATFQNLLDLCVAQNQVPSNVAKNAKSKALNPRVVLPSKKKRWVEKLSEDVQKVAPDTIQKIMAAIPDLKPRLTIFTAAKTGLRAGEQCVIRIYEKKHHKLGGIDFENNCIWVQQAMKRGAKKSENFIGEPKSPTSKRRVPIGPDLSNTLREYWMALPIKEKAEGFLFPNTQGGRADPDKWRKRILYRACERAGLSKQERPTWHMLRHCYATAMLTTHGRDWIKCMERMGHADISTTMMYKHSIINV